MVEPVCRAIRNGAGSLRNLIIPRALPPLAGEAVGGEEEVADPQSAHTGEPRVFIREILEALPPNQITVNGELRLSTSGQGSIVFRKGGPGEVAQVRAVMVALELMELVETLSVSPQSTRTELARHVQDGAPLSARAEKMLERYALGEFQRTIGWSTPDASMALSMPRIQSVFRLADGVAATVRSGVLVDNEGRTTLVNPERQKLDDAHEAIRGEVEKRLDAIAQQLPIDRVLQVEESPLLSATGAAPIALKTGERLPAEKVRDTMLRLELLFDADVVVFGALYDHVKRHTPLSEGEVQRIDSFGLGTAFQSAAADTSGTRWGIEVPAAVRSVVLSGVLPVRDELWLTNPERQEHPQRTASSRAI